MHPTDLTDPRLVARRASLYALAFAVAGEALTVQQQMLADLRTRAAGLMATATVTTSLFGGPLVGAAGHGSAAYVAIAAFVGVGLCTLGLLWPRHMVLLTDAASLIADHAEPVGRPLPLVHRELALHRAEMLVLNRRQLERMTLLLRAALGLLSVEVVAWVVNVALSA